MNSRSAQRGVALITAVVLVALATVLATAIAFGTALAARRAAGSTAVEQGFELALGAEGLAAYALREDLGGKPVVPGGGTNPPPPSQNQAQDAPSEEWARPYGPVEVSPGVSLAAKLDDEQGKFNLNSLIAADGRPDEESLAIFRALLHLLQLEDKWLDLTLDWIDRDPDVSGNGGEDSLYTAQQPGYRPANHFITSVSELMQLPEFGRERFLKLRDHVTALPPQVRNINVCFATPAVLDAIVAAGSGSSSSPNRSFMAVDPRQFVQDRTAGCHPRVTDIRSSMGLPAGAQRTAMETRVTDQTEYFSLRTWITIGTTRFALYSLLRRDPLQQGQVFTVQRSFGAE